jgi:hypothetical protein
MKRGANPHSHGPRSSLQLSPKTWPEFERLFAANGGVWGGCWCMFFHKPGKFDSKDYERNKAAKHTLTSGGRAHGTIVFCGDDPVGWCQFGPREELPRIDKKRGYAPRSRDNWRITCLFIASGHRKKGFAEFAVKESLKAMRKIRVKRVEAYPVEGELSATFLWSGTPALFEGAGFSRAGPLGKKSWVYSLTLARR